MLKKQRWVCIVLLLLSLQLNIRTQEHEEIIRGDANANNEVDISDAVYVLGYLFTGGPAPYCPALADANGNHEIDITDAITLLNFLFLGKGRLAPMTAVEETVCRDYPGPAEVLRTGRFKTIAHGVTGFVDHLGNHTIRFRDFNYDGEGLPTVHVWLHVDRSTERQGISISDDLRRDWPYAREDFIFPIPREITGDMFGYVSIWCTSFPENYGYARMFRP